MKIKRGDVVLVNLEPVIGSEQGKIRPAVVIQNNIGNEYSPTTIIAPITSKSFSKEFPTNVELFSKDSGLDNDSTVLLNQIRTIDKVRIIKKMHSLSKEIMDRIDFTIKISLGLN
ncbi:type II toxin-antitoxin system PemK/MazF family toxin [Candidatus Woesearchaeota archaeon]|nr:type II toxin-antitoxin system PemK/MazF family toxin [Candidatus Woesearchaeota archaeon]